jgi:hypothetical protein
MDTQESTQNNVPTDMAQDLDTKPIVTAPEADSTPPKASSDAKPANKASKAPKKKAGTPKKKVRKKPVAQKPANPTTVPNSRPQEVQRPFPRLTLDTALQIAAQIKAKNGGNAWDTVEVAKAVGLSIKNNKFFYVTAASRDFGLTSGSRNSVKIELTELGRDIVYAPNPEAEHEKKVQAFLSVDIFKKVLEHYKGSALPEMKYLGNTLEKEFGLNPSVHEEFATLFRQNCQELGIDAGFGGSSDSNGNVRAQNAPATVIVGEPKGATKTTLKAFVIMPFVERDEKYSKGFFAEVLRSLITPAAIDAGFSVETANRQGSDVIQSTIINDLLEADLVIADLTAHNPNVLFELGVRMAHDKPVALVKSTGTGRIFDVDNMLRVVEYDANMWPSTIEKDLPKLRDHIKAAWDNRDTNQSYMKILRKGDVGSA